MYTIALCRPDNLNADFGYLEQTLIDVELLLNPAAVL